MDARGERILSDVNLAFKRDPAIDEYDYLPVLQATQNRSPVIVTMHKLALELWSTKILFQHAYYKLLSWRNREPAYKCLEPHEIACLTRAVVMINADCSVAWNIRKELILDGDLKLEDCLKLGELVFTKHPKSVETFSHRKWLLKHLLLKYPAPQISGDSCHREDPDNNEQNQNHRRSNDGNVHPQDNSNGHHICRHHANTAVDQTLHNIFLHELKVCTNAASRYQCNYYAWNYRMWVMKHCLNYSFTVLLSELTWSKSWIQQHISDHSCFQYRQFLLREMSSCQRLKCPCTTSQEADTASDSVELSLHSNGCSQHPVENHLLAELALISKLIQCYPGHETLWYHRRFVFHSILHVTEDQKEALFYQSGSLNKPGNGYLKKFRFDPNSIMPLKELVSKECEFVEEQLKSTAGHQRYLANRHIDWVKTFFPT